MSLLMHFPNAHNFEINGGEFNNVQGNINQYTILHEDLDVRRRVYSAMKDYIRADAFHNSSARSQPPRCFPASHCLWMYGPAGTGKSAIAQTVAELCHQDNTLGGTFFFTKGSTGNMLALFPTLAYQLALVVPSLYDHLWAAIREDETVFNRSASEQLDKLIVQPFIKLTDKPAPVVVIIDGLDEGDGAAIQAEIVQLILGVGIHSLPLRFLITSRPDPDLRDAFESSPYLSPAHLPLDASLDPDTDIRHFISSRLEWIYQRSMETSAGAITATVVRFIEEEHAHPNIRFNAVLQIPSQSASTSATTYDMYANSAAFQDLDRLYLHVLCKYQDRAGLARILRVIMYYRDAASAGHLEAIFGLMPGEICATLRGLHSIVNIPRDPKTPLQFLHASLNDFLADPKRSCEFHLELGYFEADLAYAYARVILLCVILACTIRERFGSGAEGAESVSGYSYPSGLLSTTLEKMAGIDIENRELPAVSSLFNIRMSLGTSGGAFEFPESDALRTTYRAILRRLETNSQRCRAIFPLSYVYLDDLAFCHSITLMDIAHTDMPSGPVAKRGAVQEKVDVFR
ncbi:hypothetical protein BD779DRAFT_1803512 [Infundibulicybe gibba]|nr:hypothetical protein BD779DRAFT_1803512 [Infundibulicybe gibba]